VREDDRAVALDVLREAPAASCPRECSRSKSDLPFFPHFLTISTPCLWSSFAPFNFSNASIVVGQIQENDTYAFGFDAQTGKFENLVSKGIIDPTKVVRTALQDAASIAGLLITTEAMVAKVPKKQSPAPAMPGGGMGGMDY
jgi:TCP-1/cpn60 chaperonin family